MQGLVLARSNPKGPCNLTSSPCQFIPYLQGLNPPPWLGSGLVVLCFGPWHRTLRALPHLRYLYPPCQVSI